MFPTLFPVFRIGFVYGLAQNWFRCRPTRGSGDAESQNQLLPWRVHGDPRDPRGIPEIPPGSRHKIPIPFAPLWSQGKQKFGISKLDSKVGSPHFCGVVKTQFKQGKNARIAGNKGIEAENTIFLLKSQLLGLK